MPNYPDFLTSTGYGKVGGLCGANCRHSFSPFYVGISTPRWSDEELRKYKEKTVTYTDPKTGEEKEISMTDAQKHLRSLERRVRDIKTRLAVEIAKGDLARPEMIIKLKRDRAAANKRIEKFCTETGLKRQVFRERVAKR